MNSYENLDSGQKCCTHCGHLDQGTSLVLKDDIPERKFIPDRTIGKGFGQGMNQQMLRIKFSKEHQSEYNKNQKLEELVSKLEFISKDDRSKVFEISQKYVENQRKLNQKCDNYNKVVGAMAYSLRKEGIIANTFDMKDLIKVLEGPIPGQLKPKCLLKVIDKWASNILVSSSRNGNFIQSKTQPKKMINLQKKQLQIDWSEQAKLVINKLFSSILHKATTFMQTIQSEAYDVDLNTIQEIENFYIEYKPLDSLNEFKGGVSPPTIDSTISFEIKEILNNPSNDNLKNYTETRIILFAQIS
ncbi:UNKNOWN [Stylonychia lemnae]|uniref:Uncharacterized protein n=1 Tax=Stylonychia lemnae TaxID=5949 RepID=A0A078A4Y2_STYLE|nr:UNKNOWN [Stylonychia lemnae]|eukprot:CDW76909.1 UNKNOWN [Stylonychia lemnae]